MWNRTPRRARELCAQLGGRAVDRAEPADLLVNCTSIGLDAADTTLKHLPIEADQLDKYECVVDFVYRDSGTPLARAARERSIPVIDGFELLVGQGALSFERFTGRAAPVGAMRTAARAG